jgi:hypothetical protein
MIETQKGLDNAAEIAAVPGLDGLYIGPSDLALALGLPPGPEQDDPRHLAATETVRRACDAAGIVAGMHNLRGVAARRHRERGFRMLTVVLDAALLRAAPRSTWPRHGRGRRRDAHRLDHHLHADRSAARADGGRAALYPRAQGPRARARHRGRLHRDR